MLDSDLSRFVTIENKHAYTVARCFSIVDLEKSVDMFSSMSMRFVISNQSLAADIVTIQRLFKL